MRRQCVEAINACRSASDMTGTVLKSARDTGKRKAAMVAMVLPCTTRLVSRGKRWDVPAGGETWRLRAERRAHSIPNRQRRRQ